MSQISKKSEDKMKGLPLASILVISFIVAISSACTKKKELRFEGNHNVYFEKSAFEGKTFHLVRGVEDIDSTASTRIRLGSSQDFGLVRAEIYQNEIRFIEVFNPQVRKETSRILVAYPITHFDRMRERNDYGEETNRIVEDTKKPWRSRKHIRIDWKNPLNKGSFGSLVYGPTGNISNVEELEEPHIEKDGTIALMQEITFSSSTWWVKLFGLDSSHEDSFRAKVRTYLMPEKKSDFKPLSYTAKDFNRYGYFFTQQNFEDPNRGLLDSTIERKANIFNVCEGSRKHSCARNKIIWHLNKDFPNEYIELARKVVNEWNNTFKKALDRTDDIVVLDESKRVNVHDPRYNVMNYYSPNTKGAPLGVANWVTHPETGEIIAARATIFGDGVRGQVAYVDQLVDLLINEKNYRDNIQALLNMSPDLEKSESVKTGTLVQMVNSFGDGSHGKALPVNSSSSLGMAQGLVQKAHEIRQLRSAGDRKLEIMKKEPSLFHLDDFKLTGSSQSKIAFLDPSSFYISGEQGNETAQSLINIASKVQDIDLNGLENMMIVADQMKLEKQILTNQAATGVHNSDLVEEATKSYILKFAKENGVQSLIDQREKIKEDVAKNVIYHTFLHEMGHAFGLRHNFASSADEKHYHESYQRVKNDPNASRSDLLGSMYTSVMDYSSHFHVPSHGLGPYDLAAIRYAYNGSINRETDTIVSRDFKFCTDHQVGESLLCQRFDAGYTVSQIIENAINLYEERYFLTSIRRDRANFNSYWNGQMSFMIRQMANIRRAADELLYGMITQRNFVPNAIKRKEVQDLNDPIRLESMGIDPMNYSHAFLALLNENKTEFLKDTGEYHPEGFGDLLRATFAATDFFQRILGTTEPGKFLLTKKGNQFELERLVNAQDDATALKHYAQVNGIQNVTKFVVENQKRVVNIGVGPYARIYSTIGEDDGFGFKVQAFGSIREKIAAMIAMGIRNLGVLKYSMASMSGNLYTYPFTRSMVYDSYGKMIIGDNRLAFYPVNIGGRQIFANLPAATSLDTKMMSTFFAVTDLVLPGQEESMLDSLRVCGDSRSECRSLFGTETASFVSSSGHESFVATQNLTNDSISFRLVKAASEIAQKRDLFVQAMKDVEKTSGEIAKKIEQAGAMRKELAERLRAYPELTSFVEGLISDSSQLKGDEKSIWSIIETQSKNFGKYGGATTAIGLEKDSEAISSLANASLMAMNNADKRLGIVTRLLGNGEAALKDTLNQKADGLFKVMLDPDFKPVFGDGPEKVVAQQKLAQQRAHLVETRALILKYAQTSSEVLEGLSVIVVAPTMVKNYNNQVVQAEQSIKFIRRLMKLTGAE